MNMRCPYCEGKMRKGQITNIECAVDYYLTLSNPAAYLKGLSKDNRPVIVQLVFAADLVNAVACDFDLEEIKAEALREMESDEKSQLHFVSCQ